MTIDGLLIAWRDWVDVSVIELTVLVTVVWMIDRLAEFRFHPHVRNGLWMLVLVRLCMAPAWAERVPGAGLSIPLAGPAAAAAETAPATLAGMLPWLFAVWLLGAAGLLLLWARQAATAGRRLRALSCVEQERFAGMCTTFEGRSRRWKGRILVDPSAEAPYVAGLLKAALVLPRDWASWPVRTLSHALEHEATHLRRRDLWVEAGWMAAAACYWFHPLVHMARRRAHDTREASCDATVAHRLGSGYRRSLLELATGRPRRGAYAPLPRHGWGPIVVRIHLLERWSVPMTRRRRIIAAMALVAGACLILPSHVRARAVPAASGLTVGQLTDPAARQELGLGSLHVRYELMRRNNLEGRSR